MNLIVNGSFEDDGPWRPGAMPPRRAVPVIAHGGEWVLTPQQLASLTVPRWRRRCALRLRRLAAWIESR